MSLLFKHLRIHQVFGANTDVGKTILTCALVRASALSKQNTNVFYLKPVSTGPPEDADDNHIKRYAGSILPHRIRTECLFRYDEPVSPHLAVQMSGVSEAPSDQTLVNSIADYIRRSAIIAPKERAHMYIETAGGVHSPTLSGTTQVETYRALFLPTILIGDFKLGGISTTIAAYEALLLRGYIVDAILIFRDDYYRNSEYLKSYFAEKGVYVGAVDPPPPLHSTKAENIAATEKYYETLVSQHLLKHEKEFENVGKGEMLHVVDHLDTCHTLRLEELASMPRRTLDTVWWPFVQHGLIKDERDVTVIDSAYSDFFSVYKDSSSASSLPVSTLAPNMPSTSLLMPQFDASASWWTQTFGHATTSLTIAAARASGRYGHVMFPQATHLPALKLAERLVKDGPGRGWASRAFISDNGSTGMEVALKMALRSFTVRCGRRDKERKEVLGVLGLKGSYHGDTIGAMDACEEAGVYTCEWHEAKGFWFDPPTVAFQDGSMVISVPDSFGISTKSLAGSIAWTYDMDVRLNSDLACGYKDYITRTLSSLERRRREGHVDVPRLAALVLEPLVMGAGGMLFVDPLFQRVLIDVIRGGGTELGLGPPADNASSPLSQEWSGLPVIFDEVFVGLYRLGMESTGPLLGALPDISVYAKILTGGLVPLAATLASESIFHAFLGDGKAAALLHGHSYTAHAVGCEVAGETLKVVDQLKQGEGWKTAKAMWEEDGIEQAAEDRRVWSFWDPGFVRSVSRMAAVEKVMTLGCVLAIKVRDEAGGYVSHSAQKIFAPLNEVVIEKGGISAAPGGAQYNVHFRTLGNVGYFMTSLNTPADVIRSIEDKIWRALLIT